MFLADYFGLRIDGLDGSQYRLHQFGGKISDAHKAVGFMYGNNGGFCRVLALEQHIFTGAQMAIEFLVVAVLVVADAIPLGLLHTKGFDVAHLVGTVIVICAELIGLIMATELFLWCHNNYKSYLSSLQ